MPNLCPTIYNYDKCSTNSKPISSIYKIKKTVPTECPKV